MILHSGSQLHRPRHRLSWALLAFASGAINAAGFVVCGLFVTHVSGNLTAATTRWMQPGLQLALGALAVPVGFLLGVLLSAWLIDGRHRRGLRPWHAAPLALSTLLLLLVAAGPGRALPEFGRVALVALPLSVASGLLNAAVASSTGSAVRVTHLTGPLTDLGTGLVRCLFPSRHQERRKADARNTLLRAQTVLAFVLGAPVGTWLAVTHHALGMLVPAGCVLAALGLSFVAKRRLPDEHRPSVELEPARVQEP